jgi:hypothetical protein
LKATPLERARRYIAKCLPAISGQSGHNATFYVAAVLVHGFALGEADALVLLREFNQRCLPPWQRRRIDSQNQVGGECGSPFTPWPFIGR